MWVRSPVYFYKRNDTFYFSRAVPSDFRHRFNKKKIEVSLRSKSESKAAKSAAALSDRLERYWTTRMGYEGGIYEGYFIDNNRIMHQPQSFGLGRHRKRIY